ncbi:HlyD family secretion protein [Paenibacillus massiliensis]|uniref:HlyD family secretion protein n=1 Tax=Paenibacillus massiliensis TaxID=225917 RepID=UPI000402D577|nr:HlyD family efflux transporter periplasmic adaptor subunit [Paenibacillus massiliensis]
MTIKKYTIYAGLILIIALGFYALFAFQGTQTTAGQSDFSGTSGSVESDIINASFKTSGRISELLVNEGDKVTKGQVIARIENKELEDKVKQAEAALQAAKANVSKAKAGVSQAKATVGAAEAKKSQGNTAVGVTSQTVESQIAQAKAASAAAKAKLDALKTGARPQEIQQAQLNQQIAKSAYELATTQLQRIRDLKDAGAATQAQLDQATLDHSQAKTKYEVASQQLDLIQQGSRSEEIAAAEAQYQQALAAVKEAQAGAGQVTLKQEDVKAAQASVEQAQSAVKQAQSTVEGAESQVAQAEAALQEVQTYVGYSELLAPADGVIRSKTLNLGELASAGFAVYTIETTGERWAKFYVPETQLNGLHVGDEVQVSLLSDQSVVKGKVAVMDAAADFATQRPSQNSGDTDVRSFGIKVLLTDLPDTVPTGSTVFLQQGAH